MKSKLFGASIKPDCRYCEYLSDDGANRCLRGKQFKNGKCRKFSYDPLMREPAVNMPLRKYSENDFRID